MSSKTRRASFRTSIDHLEDRRVLSAYGNPWPDPTHLSLSFAPDGTGDAGQSSALFHSMQSVGTTSTWQSTILRAYQTWAQVANIDIGVTPDSGQAFGTFGAVQGDSRFGDIRIGAILQAPGVLAVTQPFSYTGGTWGGDLNFNTADLFSLNGQTNTEDLSTLALHEAGHSLGLPDNNDPSSIMYTNYQGVRGLSPDDISDIQELYGTRPTDTQANYNSWAPTSLTPANSNGSNINASNVVANDTIANPSDQHNYSFNVGWPGNYNVDVTTSGFSSLLTKVTVYNQWGWQVGSATAKDPTSGNLIVSLPNLNWGTYHFTVQAATSDVFGVGNYAVRVLPSSLAAPSSSLAALDNYVNGLVNTTVNTTVATALPLVSKLTSLGTLNYQYHGSLSSNAPVEYLKITTPSSGPNVMTINLARLDSTGLNTAVSLLDAWGNTVSTAQIQAQEGLDVIQLTSAALNSTYYVKVSSPVLSGTGSTGNYALEAAFGSFTENTTLTGSGTLTPTVNGSGTTWSPQAAQSLTAAPNGIVYFQFMGWSNTNSQNTKLQLTISDATGKVVWTLDDKVNQVVSLNLWLGQGTYKLLVTATTPGNSPAQPIQWFLFTEQLSTPMLSVGYPGVGSSPTTYPPGQKAPVG